MKNKITSPFLLAAVGVALCTIAMSVSLLTAQEKESRMLRHVVLFKFKDTSSKEEVEKVVDAFRSLKTSIPQVADFEFGTDNSPEGLANGFTHCFLITFKSEADRDVYLPHPKHKEFVDILKPHLDKVQVIDYWASK
jgi:hypothetical protein